MIASLPWYDVDELRPQTDALWRRLGWWCRREGVKEVPAELERCVPFEEQWRRDALLFSQACGYDVLIPQKDTLQIVATPCYAAPGCEGALYSSLVIVREDDEARQVADLRDRRCVINSRTSHSGMNVLRAVVAPLQEEGRFFSTVEISGSHRQSLARIREGTADVAAVDCVTHELLRRHVPHATDGTRVLAGTPRVPAPPFVTSQATSPEDVARLRGALAHTLTDDTLSDVLGMLLLDGVELHLDAYWVIGDLEAKARSYGYNEIAPDLGGPSPDEGPRTAC